MNVTRKSARTPTTGKRPPQGFTDEEKAAMKERFGEKTAGDHADGEQEVLAKIAEMPEPDRALAERLHAIVKASAPELSPRTWYGMPAYARDGNIICPFQDAGKFRMRYATLGFSDKAKLDKGSMWPVAYALRELTPTSRLRSPISSGRRQAEGLEAAPHQS